MVRKYLNCLDELRVIQAVVQNKIKIMEGLLLDCERIEKEWKDECLEENTDEHAESMSDRVRWALQLLRDKIRDIDVLVDHFHTAMGEVSEDVQFCGLTRCESISNLVFPCASISFSNYAPLSKMNSPSQPTATTRLFFFLRPSRWCSCRCLSSPPTSA
jgi:hypothetical protein